MIWVLAFAAHITLLRCYNGSDRYFFPKQNVVHPAMSCV